MLSKNEAPWLRTSEAIDRDKDRDKDNNPSTHPIHPTQLNAQREQLTTDGRPTPPINTPTAHRPVSEHPTPVGAP